MTALAYRDFRCHPVTEILRLAAMGAIPVDSELDELRLPTSARGALTEAAVQAACIQANGHSAAARRAAAEAAEAIIRELPADLKDPDYQDHLPPKVAA